MCYIFRTIGTAESEKKHMYIKRNMYLSTGTSHQLQERLHYMPLVTEHISRSPVTDYASSFSNTPPITEHISSYSPHQQLHYTPPVTVAPPITRTTAVSVLHLLIQRHANVNRCFSSFNYISNKVLRL